MVLVMIWTPAAPPSIATPAQAHRIYKRIGGSLNKADFIAKIIDRGEKVTFSGKEIMMWREVPSDTVYFEDNYKYAEDK